LDLRIRQLSQGKKGLQDIINQLAIKYPKEKSFKDSELIPEIIKLTFPELGTFFSDFVEGTKPLPLEETFSALGYTFKRMQQVTDFSFGSLKMVINQENKRLMVYDISEMDNFGKKLGFKEGDQLLTINGKDVNQLNFREMKSNWYANVKEGDWLKVMVLRPNKRGQWRNKKLKAKAIRVPLVREDILEKNSNPDPNQVQMLNWWMGKN
jgi:predicted metalloprotease with PDZ domain